MAGYFEWAYRKNIWESELGLPGTEYGPVDGSCEHGNEQPGSIDGYKFLDQLSD
jgi:hypothetical protein